MDPAAALKAAAKLKPEGAVPSAAPYRAYFGAGPDAARAAAAADGNALGDGIAVACAVAGAALLAVAALLWLRPRRTGPRDGRRRG